jgi:hypothetical protein
MNRANKIVDSLLEGDDDYLIPKLSGRNLREKLKQFLWPLRGRTFGWGVNPEGNVEINAGVLDAKQLVQVKEFLQSLGVNILRARRLAAAQNHPVREPGVWFTVGTFVIDGKDILHDETYQLLASKPLTSGPDADKYYAEEI